MTLRIRILHVVWDLSQGGLERLVQQMSASLDHDRFDVHVLSLRGLGACAEGLEGLATLHVAGAMSPLSMIAPYRLRRLIEAIGPDVVHTHSGVWYKASKAARWAGVGALVHTDHGRLPDESAIDVWVDRLAARRTDRVIAVTPWLCGFFEDELRVPPEKILLLPNGVDIARFAARRVGPHPPSFPEGRPVIGSVGRLDPVKGFNVMLVAFQRLLEEYPGEARPFLMLVGDGPERVALERLIGELGLRNDVALTGWLGEIESVLPWFDIFTMASHSEGTSLSLLEAMSAQLCPIVTAVGGNPEVLGESLAHRLVPPDDPEALALAWATALRDPEGRAADGCRARKRVEETYSFARMLAAHERLYADLTKEAVR